MGIRLGYLLQPVWTRSGPLGYLERVFPRVQNQAINLFYINLCHSLHNDAKVAILALELSQELARAIIDHTKFETACSGSGNQLCSSCL